MRIQQNHPRNESFSSFQALATSLPATKLGRVIALLPDIHELRSRGHKTRAIWESLHADGIEMSYDMFRVYLGRARRRLATNRAPILPEMARSQPRQGSSASHVRVADTGKELAGGQHDPFAGIRRSVEQESRERFDYDALLPLKEDLLR